MSYAKPLVTIDLEEYNELLKIKDVEINSAVLADVGEEISMLKEVVCAFIKSGYGISHGAINDLRMKNIEFGIQQNTATGTLGPENIKVQRIQR